MEHRRKWIGTYRTFFSRFPSFDAKLASQEPTLKAFAATTSQSVERHTPLPSGRYPILWLKPSPFGTRQQGVVQSV